MPDSETCIGIMHDDYHFAVWVDNMIFLLHGDASALRSASRHCRQRERSLKLGGKDRIEDQCFRQ